MKPIENIEKARNALKRLLTLQAQLREAGHAPLPGWRYGSVDSILLALGKDWTPMPKPAGIPWGQPRCCFMNALNLAARRQDLTYCEGYAVRYIPVHHAWVVTPDGRVVDNTWRPDGEHKTGLAYFGIPLQTSFVRDVVVRKSSYGVLYPEVSGAHEWPLMTEDPARFLREVIGASAPTYHERVASFKRELVQEALAAAGGNRTIAAEALGLQRTHLHRLMRELNVEAPPGLQGAKGKRQAAALRRAS